MGNFTTNPDRAAQGKERFSIIIRIINESDSQLSDLSGEKSRLSHAILI